MKKKSLAALSLFLPLTILCACGSTPTQAFSANWYRDTSIRDIMSGKTEKLAYEVTFEPKDTKPLSVSYEKGTYTTELTAMAMQLPDSEKTETVYRYATRLDIKGKYSLNGQDGDVFTDSVESTVYFRSLSGGLQPVSSTKHVISTSPTGRTEKLEDAYITYDYTYTVNYNEALSKAEVKLDQIKPAEAKRERKVSLSGAVNYFDNEQLEFILRGLDMTSAVSLKTMNPLDSSVSPVAIKETPKESLETMTFRVGDTTVNESIPAYTFAFGYSSANSGQNLTLVYAKRSADKSNNRFRNVMLKRTVPVLQGLGNLIYTLTEADFID